MAQIITSDKSIIFGYKRKPTLKESQPDNILCPWCGKPKKQMGRIWFCVECKSAKLSTGKSIGKIPSKFYQK